MENEFIGFTYNGEHSITNYHVYRTSDGSRYNHNLIPQLNEKTADVPGGHGQYYFNSTYKTRQFSISIAFDDLSEEQFHRMKKWLSGTGIHELSFDERPQVKYSAKVTGTPQLKFICFEKDGANIYKGEGTIQFTCYFPFGYGQEMSNTISYSRTDNQIDEIEKTIKLHIDDVPDGDWPTTFILEGTNIAENTEIEVGGLIIKPSQRTFIWDSKTGIVSVNSQIIAYTGTGYGTIGPNTTTVKAKLSKDGKIVIRTKPLYL